MAGTTKRGSSTPRVGSQLAGYKLERVLGRGGMSVVYLGQHQRLKRKAAVKVLSPELAEDDSFRRRFIKESELAASLDHPNIIPIFEAGETRGVLFIAMRFVESTDLAALVEAEGPLPAERTLSLIAQTASALDAANAQGLVHRDVKPANVLVAKGGGTGKTDHVYLSDFGLTKHMASKSGLTKTGFFVGTMHYAAPEQIEGKPLDGRTDQYALGCVLFECLAGRPPFVREDERALMWAHLSEPPPSLHSLRPDLPPAIDTVIARALAKGKEDRFLDCSSLAEAARSALSGAPVTTPPSGPDRRLRTAAAKSFLRRGGKEPAGPPRHGTVAVEGGRVSGAPRRSRRSLLWTAATAAVALATVAVILVAVRGGEEPGPVIEDPSAFRVATGLGLGSEPLLLIDTDVGSSITWHPDGGDIAFDSRRQRNSEILSLNLATSESKNLTLDPSNDSEPAWSPDGKRIAFVSDRDGGLGHLYVMNAEDTLRGRASPLTDGFARDDSPAWSPDGNQIAFVSNRGGTTGPTFDIYVLNVEDRTIGPPIREIPGNESELAWSPDGTRIAFTSISNEAEANEDVFVMNADGTGEVTQLTEEPGADSDPSWSPDGRQIAFTSDRDGNSDVYLMGADGSDVEQLTDDPNSDFLPAWAPDGSAIAFVSDRQGPLGIFATLPEGEPFTPEPTIETPFFTVILATVPEEEGGEAEAERVRTSVQQDGVRGANILDANDFPSLTPGTFVVHAGVFEFLEDAERRAQKLRDLGFQDAGAACVGTVNECEETGPPVDF